MTKKEKFLKLARKILICCVAAAACFGVYKLIATGLLTEILFANEKNYLIVTTDLSVSKRDEAEVSFRKIPLSDDADDEKGWEPLEYWSENNCYHALLGRGYYSVRICHPDLGISRGVIVIDGSSDVYSLQLNYYFNNDSTNIDRSDYLVTAQGDYIPNTAKVWNGHAYMILNRRKDWLEARELCEGLGGHLATITSEEEQTVITELMADSSDHNFWLGSYSKDGAWIWITGEAFEYQSWAPGEPNAKESGMVMQFMRDKGWDDTYYHGRLENNLPIQRIICEWELAAPEASE